MSGEATTLKYKEATTLKYKIAFLLCRKRQGAKKFFACNLLQAKIKAMQSQPEPLKEQKHISNHTNTTAKKQFRKTTTKTQTNPPTTTTQKTKRFLPSNAYLVWVEKKKEERTESEAG